MTKSEDKAARELRSIRDTVESFWVALVLAFVLRAFMIEAFVIPTGSMAPRLMGEHWQLTCPACGYDYAFGVPRAAQVSSFDRTVAEIPTAAFCPNCGYRYGRSHNRLYPRSGDRVLVMKYLYRFAEPRPWDVVVFRNPQNNRENYIKRLIGLPGESIEIIHGNIFVSRDGQSWQIRRKPRRAQEAMWQVVFDNDYRPDMEMLAAQGVRPPRWEGVSGGWKQRQDGRQFVFDGLAESAELVFQAPRAAFWPRYGYNRNGTQEELFDEDADVCTDLKLSVVFVPKAENSTLTLSLSSFEHRFKAELRTDGEAVLYHDPPDDKEGNWREWGRKKLQALEIGRGCRVALSHVDFRVSLEVDGEVVLASSDLQYYPDHEKLEQRMRAAAMRPVPAPDVKIAASGGPCRLMHVKLYRDVFYTGPVKLQRIPDGPLGDFARRLGVSGGSPGWGTMDNKIRLKKWAENPELDEFFVLGDNSPQSLDGRAWASASPTLRLWRKDGKVLGKYEQGAEALYKLGTVPRYNLIGKAFFVYWPAGFHIPALPGLPILPNAGKMRLIR